MTPGSDTRHATARSVALVALALGAARAALDVRAIARDESLAAAAPLFPRALAEACTVLLAALATAMIATSIADRALSRFTRASRADRAEDGGSPARGAGAFPTLLAAGLAALVASEVWLRGFEALDLRPGPPPAGVLVPILLRAAAVLLVGAPALALALRALVRRLAPTFPGARSVAAAAALAALAALASVAGPPTLTSLRDRTERAARLARLADPPNILLIVLDTVRADRISCYGFPEDATPEIDRLAREGTTFSEATTPAPWTLPAHASLFTGLYPSEHGAHYGHLHLDRDATTMAELLATLGYRTVGFSKKTWLSRGMGTTQGFERYRDFRLPEPRRRLLLARLAASAREARRGRVERHGDAGGHEIASAAADWLRARERRDDRAPFFLFANFNEAHLPFLPPRPYWLRFAGTMPRDEALLANLDPMVYIAGEVRLSPDDVDVLRALYAGEIAYLDRQIGRIVGALEETGALDRTLVIVTSDHGENIADHALMGHVLCVYETLLRVPLVVRYPARFPRGTIDARPVQLTDLLPTIVDLVEPGAADLLPKISGRSLVAAEERGFAIAEYQRPDNYLDRYPERFPTFDTSPFRRDLASLSAGAMKLIEGSDGRRELYDLTEDPGEERDLAASRPERAAELADALARFRERLRARAESAESPEIDAATREELRSLGYIK